MAGVARFLLGKGPLIAEATHRANCSRRSQPDRFADRYTLASIKSVPGDCLPACVPLGSEPLNTAVHLMQNAAARFRQMLTSEFVSVNPTASHDMGERLR